jgi:hypothetical protein
MWYVDLRLWRVWTVKTVRLVEDAAQLPDVVEGRGYSCFEAFHVGVSWMRCSMLNGGYS